MALRGKGTEPPARKPARRDDDLEALLQIDPDSLDDALISQPPAFQKVGEALAMAVSRRDAAKDELKIIEAKTDDRVRAMFADSGEKVTETAIKNQIVLDAKVQAAQKNLRDLEYEVGKLGALKDAFNQRSYALKDLVSLHLSAHYSADSASARGDLASATVADTRRQQQEHRNAKKQRS